MFRKMLFGFVASLGLLSMLVTPAGAQAHEYWHGHRHEHGFRVYYRDPCRSGWVFAGTFRERPRAVRFADGFICRGLVVRIL
jgi:hypothetical protein